jgi:hypothetical protein
VALAELAVDWDLTRLRGLLRDFPWFRTASADQHGPTYDGFALFNYTPWHIAKRDDDLRYVSSLILDFKKNESAAKEAVRLITITALHELIWRNKWKGQELPQNKEDRWWQTMDAVSSDVPGVLGLGWHDWMLIVVPGSGKGIGKPSTRAFAESICSVPWYPAAELGDPPHLAYLTLERHTAQTPAHVERKTWVQQRETLRLIDTPKPEGARYWDGALSLMLVDDVYTTGATYTACKHLVRERHPAANVMGMFLAITAY